MGDLKRALLCFVASGLLSGCSALQWIDKQGSFAVAADTLNTKTIDKALGDTTPDQVKADVQMVAYDSEQKCNQFLADLMVNETGTNTALDVATSAVTATASALAGPVSTIRGLAAAGAFTSGTKTAIGSDFFAKASIANYSQAIQATYFTQMTAYVTSLKSSGLPPEAEVHSWAANQISTIQIYHSECGLGAAQNALQGTLALAQSQQQNQPTTATTISVTAASGTAAAADALVLIVGQSTSVTLPPVTLKITSGETVANIAKGLVTAFQSMVSSSHSEIVVTAGADGSSINVTAPTSENITWKPSVVDTTATASGISFTPKVAPAPAPAAPNPPPSTTSSQAPTPKVGAPIQTQLQ